MNRNILKIKESVSSGIPCTFRLLVRLFVAFLIGHDNGDKQRPTKRGEAQGMLDETGPLKGQGHVTVKKSVISIIYIVPHTWPLCAAHILVDGVNP